MGKTMNDFEQGFFGTFEKGMAIGSAGFINSRNTRIDAEKEIRKRQKEIAENNAQLKSFATSIGMPLEVDATGQLIMGKAPEGYQFRRPAPNVEAQLFAGMSNDQQQAYKQLVDVVEKKPEIDHILHRSVLNRETGKGELVAFNRKTKQLEKVADDPYYTPKKVWSNVVEGEIDVDGKKYGKRGRRTRVTKNELGQVESIDLGVKSKTGGDSKTTDDLAFELDMAELNDKLYDVKIRRDKYINGKFPDETARENYRNGINSQLNLLALQYGKMIKDPQARKEIAEIIVKGRQEITEGKIDRAGFYEREKNRITNDWIGEGGEYKDLQAMLKVLEIKYGGHVPSEDSKVDADETLFDDFQIDEE